MKIKVFNQKYKKRAAILVRPFFILFFISLSPALCAQFFFTEASQAKYKEVLKLKSVTGFPSAQQDQAANGINTYIEHLAETIKMLVEENPELLDRYKQNSEAAEIKVSGLNPNSPYYLFVLGEIKLQRAFVKLKFGEEISSMWELRLAYKTLAENAIKHPDFLPNNKSIGLLKILVGSIPEKYTWIVNLVGMEGSVKEGLEMLKTVSESETPFASEAKILRIAVLNFILGKETGSEKAVKDLYLSENDNLLYTFLYASVCMKNAHSEEALCILESSPDYSSNYLNFAYLYLMTGDIYLQKGIYTKAFYLYKRFLNEYRGGNFKKEAYYKIFLCYWLNNEDDKAIQILPQIKKEGNAIYDGDKYALYFAENRDFSDKNIMKVRLAIDGGYFNTAEDILQKLSPNDFHSQKDKIEYYYRFARFYHKTGKIIEAIKFYKKTIDLSGDKKLYFAPNAALQLGYIYRYQNNKEQAVFYFEKALTYKDYYYKNGIDNKARGALNEIKKI
ncbi:hypothetical protein CHU_1807 [Sporocytophaga myxococcoides]|uniref:Tetratricopeptide repeat protein n=1 Tax=Sporocytophaga myxococcoides TaxID=153721 RepID=A0A098L8X6_9BACT|nr:tetratricopeptide repeat protein [Sporocytophaga myxococcoides]GAL83305.1 hypothetical protein CHU_1807 [Sporocytophaga myxococcoides]